MRPPASLSFIFFAVLAGLALAVPVTNAANQSFRTAPSGGNQDFAYTYVTPQGRTQNLTFRLNLDDIARGSAEFQRWDAAEANRLALADARKAANAFNTPTLKVDVTIRGNTVATGLTGLGKLPDETAQQRIQQAVIQGYDTGRAEYARRTLYKVKRVDETLSTIQPDYAAIAKRYTAAMGPVARALAEQALGNDRSPRAFINAALTWLQNIPYDTLQDRHNSNGAGFQTPYGLMLGNLGDCDTKTVALAAILRSAYPSLPIAIIQVPQHAFIGIGLPQTDKDFALRTEYGTYILAEPTGPGLIPLGDIDARTQASLRTAEIDVLPIP